MEFIRRLPDVDEIRNEYSLTDEHRKGRKELIQTEEAILSGRDGRKLLIVGPCSADREDSVLDYVTRLVAVAEKVREKLVIIPRIYTSKPRTTGIGYKGLLHNQKLKAGGDDLWDGVIAIRRMHQRVILETGMFGADEMLYPEMLYYILDLLAYVSVGARSVEDQGHRLTASGVGVPVGMKNPTDGSLKNMINAIIAAQSPQMMIYRGWEVKNEGNRYAHAILRGYTTAAGEYQPNYHFETLCRLHDMYKKENLANMSVIVDCNHANSAKKYDQQPRIARDVMESCRISPDICRMVKGLMIESYIEDGSQIMDEGVYGRSVTDPCLGWEKTERLILELAELV